MAKTRPEVQEIIDWAVGLGWTYEGYNGRLHHTISLGNKRVTLPNTPSDTRSLKNAEADVRRFTGPGTPPRVARNSGKFRKGMSRSRSRFSLDAALAERDERESQVAPRHARLDELEARLKSLDPRRDFAECKRLACEIVRLDHECKKTGCDHGDE